MDEMVFFNPGDAIANSKDYGEAVRGAQIYKAKDPYESSLIIAQDMTDNKSFAVYFAKDEKKGVKDINVDNESVIPYHIKKKI
ncbi:hypothetical protein LCR01_07350 [Companilactobacillus crustorum]|uniref:Uncharacterized protein n=3 Tax=Companilactobacillus TaxID=2767879 RepID=A0A837RJT5_9LACO|nr:hypothetical protein [Companilactobacillus crustorum]KRK43262.1 hypothetical protein FD26_GL002121 [Companilactobacillus crustorum JCM 15951]KRO20839.1 hypothetical protein IV63_GL000169 [Companilactobacillus crustorum]GEO76292.1 hypothetical protein LCR01_07350 [Companilactobacillus crustorum]HCD07555.1 hypothetical protein [Lactobacillus sp.]